MLERVLSDQEYLVKRCFEYIKKDASKQDSGGDLRIKRIKRMDEDAERVENSVRALSLT